MKKTNCFVSNARRKSKLRRRRRLLLWKQQKCRKRGGRRNYASIRNLGGPARFVRIVAPEVWGIGRPDIRSELLRFVETCRQTLLIGASYAIIDFSQVQTIYPNGALLVVAELDRISRLIDTERKLRCKPAPKGSLPDQVLTQIGLYRCLNHSSQTNADDESVVHWRRASGVKAEGGEAEPMLNDFDGEISEALKTSLYRGITEAMTNAVQHAYLDRRDDGTK
jgi:hypothetical protein